MSLELPFSGGYYMAMLIKFRECFIQFSEFGEGCRQYNRGFQCLYVFFTGNLLLKAFNRSDHIAFAFEPLVYLQLFVFIRSVSTCITSDNAFDYEICSFMDSTSMFDKFTSGKFVRDHD